MDADQLKLWEAADQRLACRSFTMTCCFVSRVVTGETRASHISNRSVCIQKPDNPKAENGDQQTESLKPDQEQITLPVEEVPNNRLAGIPHSQSIFYTCQSMGIFKKSLKHNFWCLL